MSIFSKSNSIVNFANYNQRCSDASLTTLIQYLGFFLLIQALIVILIEKILIKFPRISGKIERFYRIIVEEALYGNDPDVIEDITDWKSNPEAIKRQRRKNEICIGLKRSSVISKTFIYKNIAEIFILGLFIIFNIIYGIDSEKNLLPGICILNVKDIPNLGLEEDGFISFDCEGKRVSFYLKLLYIQIATQFLILICCLGSLVWNSFFRNVTQLLEKMERSKIDWDVELAENEGEDFLFLFDLLAHTAGIEATLRVLTHADETFRKICLPKLTVSDQVKVEEEKLKVYWKAASLECWLEDNNHKGIRVESYDVTIFPRESINTSVTKMKDDKDSEGNYSAWFYDLQGGRTEYIVTIACVLGRSRMKGEQVVTTLLPYGPESPPGGLVKSVSTEEVEITWEAPKGGFTKYVLCVDPEVGTARPGPAVSKFYSNNQGHIGSYISFDKIVQLQHYTERELSNLINNYKISGLKPGETYSLALKTMTGGRYTRRPLCETLLTKPLEVEDFRLDQVSSDQATLCWIVPEAHRRLRAFRILISSADGGVKRELAVRHQPERILNSFLVESIRPATFYTASIKTVCVFENLRTISEEKTLTFVSLPEAPTNLSLENSSPSSLTVRWDLSQQQPQAQTIKVKLSIENSDLGYSSEYHSTGEKNTFNFSKLPDVVGSGIYNN